MKPLSQKRKAIVEEFKKSVLALMELEEIKNKYLAGLIRNNFEFYLNDYTESIVRMIREMPIISPHDPSPIIDQVFEELNK